MNAQHLDPFKVACACFGVASLKARPAATVAALDELTQVVGMDAVRFALCVHDGLTGKPDAPLVVER